MLSARAFVNVYVFGRFPISDGVNCDIYELISSSVTRSSTLTLSKRSSGSHWTSEMMSSGLYGGV